MTKDIKIEVRITKVTHEKLKELALLDESSCSAVVRKAITKYIKDVKEAK